LREHDVAQLMDYQERLKTLADIVRYFANELGYTSIQVPERMQEVLPNVFLDDEVLREIRELAEDKQVYISLHVDDRQTNLACADGHSKEGDPDSDSIIRRAKESIDLAIKLGADYVVFHPGFIPGTEYEEVIKEALQRVAGRLQHIMAYAQRQERPVTVVLENNHSMEEREKHIVRIDTRIEHFQYLRKILGFGPLHLCLDTGHTALQAVCEADDVDPRVANTKEIQRIIERAMDKWLTFAEELGEEGGKLFIHLNDTDGTKDQHLIPGDGLIPYDSFFTGLMVRGLRVVDIILEVATDKGYRDRGLMFTAQEIPQFYKRAGEMADSLIGLGGIGAVLADEIVQADILPEIVERLSKSSEPPIACKGRKKGEGENYVEFKELTEFGELIYRQWRWLRPVYVLAMPSPKDGKPVYFTISPDTEKGREMAHRAYRAGYPVSLLFELAYESPQLSYEGRKYVQPTDTGAYGCQGRALFSPSLVRGEVQFIAYIGVGLTPSYPYKPIEENFAIGYRLSGLLASDEAETRREVAERLTQIGLEPGIASRVIIPVVSRIAKLKSLWSAAEKRVVRASQLEEQLIETGDKNTDWQRPVVVTFNPQAMGDIVTLDDIQKMPEEMRLEVIEYILREDGWEVPGGKGTPRYKGNLISIYIEYLSRNVGAQMALWFRHGYIHCVVSSHNISARGNLRDLATAMPYNWEEAQTDILCAKHDILNDAVVDLTNTTDQFSRERLRAKQFLLQGFIRASNYCPWDDIRRDILSSITVAIKPGKPKTIKLKPHRKNYELIEVFYEIILDEFVNAGLLESTEDKSVYRITNVCCDMDLAEFDWSVFKEDLIAPTNIGQLNADRNRIRWDQERLERALKYVEVDGSGIDGVELVTEPPAAEPRAVNPAELATPDTQGLFAALFIPFFTLASGVVNLYLWVGIGLVLAIGLLVFGIGGRPWIGLERVFGYRPPGKVAIWRTQELRPDKSPVETVVRPTLVRAGECV